jgi:hypothetical protein
MRSRGVTVVDESDPLRDLSRAARQELNERGWYITVGLPNPKVLKRMELMVVEPINHQSFEIYGDSRKVDLVDSEPGRASLELTRSNEIGPEYDRLWDAARKNLGIECSLLRDARGLRAGRGRSFRLEARRPGSPELVGYASFNTFEWNLDDVLAVDAEAMVEVLTSATSWLRTNRDQHRMESYTAVPHPAHREALDVIGTVDIDWLYSFSVSVPFDRVGPEADASRWYATAGD